MNEVTEADLERLCAWLDGELSEEEVQALEARLANEPALARELEALKATLGAVEALEVPEPPPAFSDKVRRRIRRRSRGRYFGGQRRATFSLEATAWALLIVLGIAAVGTLSAPVVLETPMAPPPESDPDAHLPDGASPPPPTDEEGGQDHAPPSERGTIAPEEESMRESPELGEAGDRLNAPAREGRVSRMERRPLRRFGFAWQVATELDADVLRREATQRFGASRVEADDEGVWVQLDASGWEEGLRRAAQMGTLYRERVEEQGGLEERRRVRLLPAGTPPRGEPLR